MIEAEIELISSYPSLDDNTVKVTRNGTEVRTFYFSIHDPKIALIDKVRCLVDLLNSYERNNGL